MGAARAIAGDLSVFTVDTVSQLIYVQDASITLDVQDIESSNVTTPYERSDGGVRSAVIQANLMSTVSGDIKVSNLDVSVFSIGATTLIGDLESGSFTINWKHDSGKGQNDGWLYPVFSKKTFAAEGTLRVPAVAGSTLPLLFGTLANLNVVLTITINGVTVTVACLLHVLGHTIPHEGVQRYKVSLSGQAPDLIATAYPAAPTGTTTLLEKAFNSKVAQAYVLTSKASGGTSYAGNMLLNSYNVAWPDSGLVIAGASWATQGACTPSATA